MKIPDEVLLWKFGNGSGNLRSNNHYQNNQGYNLYCKQNKQYLIWDTGQLSINLAFSSSVQNKYHFQLPDNKERDILTGEPVSFANGMGESFFRYGSQRIGINLKWTSEPLAQWRIFDATGELGKPIAVGGYYAMVNVNVDPAPDFLVYLNKHIPKVVDIGWTTSPSWIESWASAFKIISQLKGLIK